MNYKNDPKPPGWAYFLLTRLHPKQTREEVEGDLFELYCRWHKKEGAFIASCKYAFSVFSVMPPFVRRRKTRFDPYSRPKTFQLTMFKNYFKIAGRNLVKHLSFSLINIIGLALGMCCCLFILLWVANESEVDNFHSNRENIYTAYETVSNRGNITGSYRTPVRQRQDKSGIGFLMEDLPGMIPEVENVVFYATGYELPWGHPETIRVGEKSIKLNGSRASKNFFSLFSYKLLAGHPETALPAINSIAISEKMALTFFGSAEAAIGKSVRYENRLDLTVSSVFADIGSLSSLQFDFLLNWEAQKKNLEWASPDFRTFLALAPGSNVELVTAKINKALVGRIENEKNVVKNIGLQPLHDQYLRATFVNGKPVTGRIEYVRIFTSVAIFILLIACVNFMVLSTARSVKRAKEVGMRKVLGSARIDLMIQFFSEALLLSFIALMLTLGLTWLLLPVFNNFVGQQLSIPFYSQEFWTAAFALTLVTGLIAGSYPAFFLSSFEPVRSLKGVFRIERSTIWFRKGLTIFQFGLAILLLVSSVVVSRQTRFLRNRDLGYDRQNLLYFRIEGELAKQAKYEFFKQQVSQIPEVSMVDRSSETPHTMGFVVDEHNGLANTGDGTDAINWEGKQQHNGSVGFKPASVGFDFIRLMKLKMVAGRDFSRDRATDSSSAFIVNEEAVRQMGLKEPVGKRISAWEKKGQIIGVVQDFHTHSLHEQIKPVIIDVKEYEYFGVVLVRIAAGQTTQALSGLEKVYKQVNPDYPFDYHFIDQEYDSLYKIEQVMSKLSSAFTMIAIIISCLGLLGLVMFSAEQRTKEIGIRKVLGASVQSIIGLISADFLSLIGAAFMISSPVTWYLMKVWLNGFAYKIDIQAWYFVFAAIVVVGIAMLTISYQSIKAALANPVKSIKVD